MIAWGDLRRKHQRKRSAESTGGEMRSHRTPNDYDATNDTSYDLLNFHPVITPATEPTPKEKARARSEKDTRRWRKENNRSKHNVWKDMRLGQLLLFQNNVVISWHWKWSITWRWILAWKRRDPVTKLGFHWIRTYGGDGLLCCLNSRLLGDWSFHLQPNMRRCK